MDKPLRNAVRCFLIEDNRIVVTRYKEGNKKEFYYEIPGGKIEDGESAEQAAIREMKEETGITVENLKHKGIMNIEYPDREFSLQIFLTNTYQGIPQEFDENTSEWIEIDSILKKEKLLSSIIILDIFFIKKFLDDRFKFNMHIRVDEEENILNLKYELIK